MYEVRDQKNAVAAWVEAQPKCPTRKEVIAKFPEAPQRIIRAVLQSREDRERK